MFHLSFLPLQRYGLWDHEGPLEEQIPTPVSCRDDGQN